MENANREHTLFITKFDQCVSTTPIKELLQYLSIIQGCLQSITSI